MRGRSGRSATLPGKPCPHIPVTTPCFVLTKISVVAIPLRQHHSHPGVALGAWAVAVPSATRMPLNEETDVVGITLSQEQIRGAPPEVRRWLEKEIATSLGLPSGMEPIAHAEPPHLIACRSDQVRNVFSLIQGMLPVADVFFELGRDAGRLLPNGLHSFGLLDMLSHSRLTTPEQLLRCLEVIDAAMREVGGDPRATLYALDGRANCIVAEATHQNIRQLWQEVVSASAERGTVRGEGQAMLPLLGDGPAIPRSSAATPDPRASAPGTSTPVAMPQGSLPPSFG